MAEDALSNRPGVHRVRRLRHFRGRDFILDVEVDALEFDDAPGEIHYDRETSARLVRLKKLVDEGDLAELERHGTVFLRRSA